MATITQRHAQPLGYADGRSVILAGGSEDNDFYEEDASQTWGAGSLLRLDSDSDIEIVADGAVTSDILGFARAAATGTAGSAVDFLPIRPGLRCYMNVYHGTLGSAITAANQIGDPFNLYVSGGKAYVDVETAFDATNPYVRVIGFHPDDTVGDTYGRLLVEFPSQVNLQAA